MSSIRGFVNTRSCKIIIFSQQKTGLFQGLLPGVSNHQLNQGKGLNWDLFTHQYLFQKNPLPFIMWMMILFLKSPLTPNVKTSTAYFWAVIHETFPKSVKVRSKEIWSYSKWLSSIICNWLTRHQPHQKEFKIRYPGKLPILQCSLSSVTKFYATVQSDMLDQDCEMNFHTI